MNILIILIAKYLFLVSIALFLYVLWKIVPKIRKQFIIFSAATAILSYVIAKVSSHFINDPRPFVVEHVKPLIAHAADNGFPSDHMLLAMAIASVVFVYNRKYGIVLAIVAVFIGVSRVLAKVHHVEDIVGSAVIAIVTTYITYNVLPHIYNRMHEDRKTASSS